MKKSFGLLSILLIVCSALVLRLNMQKEPVMVPEPPEPIFANGTMPQIAQEQSAIGNKENPQARRDYKLAIVADPITGEVPNDIRRQEYLFSAKIPRNDKRALRTGGAKEASWRSIGPYNKGGRTRALAIDVSNEDVILAGGVSGGMWRTEDGGRNWEKTSVASSIHSVSCIVQDTRPGKTNIWYYGTGEFTSNSASKKSAPFRGDGIFKSVDGGKTWDQLVSTAEGTPNNYNSQFQYVHNIIINPFNTENDEVFLATVGAIFRSIDGGENWDVVLGRKAFSSPDTDLNKSNMSDYTDISQSIDGAFYAAFSQSSRTSSSPEKGIFRSTNGVNWTPITPVNWPGNYAKTIIAASTTSSNEVYFSVNAGSEMLWKYTYLSGDGFQTRGRWQNLSTNLPSFGGEVGDYNTQSSYNMVLEVHPENGDIVFLGGTNLYRSTDGFSSDLNTTWIGGYDTANNVKVLPNHFVDQHAVAFFPSNPDKMLSSNDGGIFVTEDNREELPVWSPLNNGFVTTQFYTLGLDEFGSKGDVMGGLQDNGTLIANKPINLSSWNALLSGDGGYTAITKNSAFYFGSFQFGKIYRFTLSNDSQIKTFTRVDPANGGGEEKLLFVNPYVLAPENQHFMYFSGGDVIWRNFNTSQIPLFKNYGTDVNWEKMAETEMHEIIITAINASYNPSGTLYYGTLLGRLFRVNQANTADYSVEEITSVNFPENSYLSSIAIDKRNSQNIAVSFSNYNIISIYYSSDGGDTFENISGNLEEYPDGTGSGPSVRWIEIVSKKDGSSSLFAATSTGVYSTDQLDGIQTVWEKEGSETIGNVLVTMIKYFSEDGTIVAATHGNGMYEANIDNVWPIEIENNSEKFALNNAFPNPFQQIVNIPFTLPRDGIVRARIYNPLGQNIKTLVWASQFSGENMISWDGTNDAGSPVITGPYFCKIEFEDQALSTRLIFKP